jgi:UDP-glucose 4-epimerase
VKILITGISGAIARLVALRLKAEGHQVLGIDRRSWADAPPDIEVFRYDIRKRAAEDVFRTRRPEAVIHMATVTHLVSSSEDRYRINLNGTRAVLEHAAHYGATRAVVVARHTFYGADHDLPLYHKEDDPPMMASSFPELADLVAADLYAGTALWRYPELSTSVLRFVYSLGPSKSGTLANFIKGPNVPTVLGFDPLFQFLHEQDVAKALSLAAIQGLRGIYNVAGPEPLPLSLVIREAGRRRVPIPEPVFRLALKRFKLPGLPAGAIAHIKYPVIVDASAFQKAAGFTHDYDNEATLAAFRDS